MTNSEMKTALLLLGWKRDFVYADVLLWKNGLNKIWLPTKTHYHAYGTITIETIDPKEKNQKQLLTIPTLEEAYEIICQL